MARPVEFRFVFCASLVMVVLMASSMTIVSGRYLPTRSNEDSLDKLRDLLRDILESDKPAPVHSSGNHLAPFYDGALSSTAERYPYGGGAPKYLRKRELSGWEFYDPSAHPLH